MNDHEPMPARAPGAASFEGTPWELIAYRDAAGALTPASTRPRRQPITTFVGGEWGGSAGCNSLWGSYTRHGAALRVEPGTSTLVGCSRRLMLQEHAYHEALQRVARFAVAGEELTLSDAAGAPVLRFRVRAPTPLVGTVWRAVLYHDGTSLSSGPWPSDRTAAFSADGRVTGVSGRITYAAPYTTHGEAGTGTIRIGPPTTALGPARAPVPPTPEAVERWVVREHLAGLREDAPSGTLSAAEEEAATREILATVRAAFAAAPVDEAPPPPSDEDEQTVARAYLGALQEAVSYRVLGHELTLQRPGGYTAVQLVPAAPPEGDA